MADLAPESFAALRLSKEKVGEPAEKSDLAIERDSRGWPMAVEELFKGEMGFQFDLAAGGAELAEALAAEPVVLLNPAARESPEIERNLFRP